jgi:hypothetical protein
MGERMRAAGSRAGEQRQSMCPRAAGANGLPFLDAERGESAELFLAEQVSGFVVDDRGDGLERGLVLRGRWCGRADRWR